MLEVFLLGFHLLDFAADASNFLLDFQDITDFAGALGEDGLQALFGFAGVFQTRDEIGVLLSDFLAVLVFVLDVAERFEFRKSCQKLRSWNAERGLNRASGSLRSADTQIGGVAVVADENGIECFAIGVEVFDKDGK